MTAVAFLQNEFYDKFKCGTKIAAEHGTGTTEEAQTLLYKKEKNMQFKLTFSGFYNELSSDKLSF